MAKTSPPASPKTFATTAEIDLAIVKLRRRVEQVARLDPAHVSYHDASVRAAESDIRSTILDVFGPGSPESLEHAHHSIWSGPHYMGSNPPRERQQFAEGITASTMMLDGLISRLNEKKQDLQAALPIAERPSLAHNRRVFIGHGHAAEWRKLKDFLSDRLGVDHEEFNRESAAGYSTVERLQEMLENSSFAFLVLTAEDEHKDGSQHARENAIHEVGLFQGRHGFKRAIVLLEEGCAEFSNIRGLTQIRFPSGNVLAQSEEIRRVLEREGLTK